MKYTCTFSVIACELVHHRNEMISQLPGLKPNIDINKLFPEN